MTTTPNDAAVNAESAAKLVSKIDFHIENRCWDDEVTCDLLRECKRLIERHATPQTQITQTDARKHDCPRCQGSGEAQIYVEDGGGSITDGPDGHTETGTCPDCDGEGEAKCGRCGAIARSDAEIAAHVCTPSATHGEGEATHWRYYSPNSSKRNANPWHRFADEKPDEKLVIDFGFEIAPLPTSAPALEPATDHICEYDGIASCRICSGTAALSGVAAQGDGEVSELLRTKAQTAATKILIDGPLPNQAQYSISVNPYVIGQVVDAVIKILKGGT